MSRTSAGSRTWDGFFQIVVEASSHLLGTELEKVGKTSGWTYGPISKTCVDEVVGFQKVLTCQFMLMASWTREIAALSYFIGRITSAVKSLCTACFRERTMQREISSTVRSLLSSKISEISHFLLPSWVNHIADVEKCLLRETLSLPQVIISPCKQRRQWKRR